MSLPRGIRNNNPCNIEYKANNKWQGMLEHDPAIEPRFCRFESAVYGIRAGAKLLINYQNKYHLNTVRGILTKYAPQIENNTAGYIQRVCDKLGVKPDQPIELTDKALALFIRAICGVENGDQYANYYPSELINRAIAMARQ